MGERAENPRAFPGAVLLGAGEFRRLPSRQDSYACRWNVEKVEDGLIQVTFDVREYPLQQHCRYARLREGLRPTFGNFEFASEEPGLRVGPWPGWRGVPELAAAWLEAGGRLIALRYQFWGDEFEEGRLRGIAILREAEQEDLLLTTDDPRIIPLRAEFFRIVTPKVVPGPAGLSPLRCHPRLLILPEDLPMLRKATQEGRRRAYERLFALLSQWDFPLQKTPESKIPPGPEGLACEDRMLVAAYLALLEPSQERIDRARKAYFEYLDLTRGEGFEPLSIDTQSGEVLFLLCVGYDWLFDHLSEGEREDARGWIWQVSSICWGHLGYERRDYAQAHFLGCGMGLVAFALLFWDDHGRAREWGTYLLGVLRWMSAALPADGYYPHGLNLWIYEMGFLLRWIELYRTAGGVDLWADFSSLAASSRFRSAATSPDGLHGITMGDPQYRVGGDSWCHFLIAARCDSAESQWLGEFLRDRPVEGVDYRNAPARRRVYEHLWYDQRIQARKPERTLEEFPDGGQIFVRSADFLFTFRSGFPVGEERRRRGILGAYGHADPCNGSFLAWSGEHFSVSGPGPVYRRESGLHNLVTIDGQGQLGDTAVWLPDFIPPNMLPPPPRVWHSGTVVSVAADLACSYLPHLGVEVMRRDLLIRAGSFILGAERVRLRRERFVEWNLHSRGEIACCATPPPLAFALGEARLVLISAGNWKWASGLSQFVPAYPNDGKTDSVLTISRKCDEALLFWCLLFAGELGVQAEDGGRRWSFSDGVVAIFTDEGFILSGANEEVP
jgi:hypothetical protein